MDYWWIRVFDYNHKRDAYEKGIMLDEFYLKDVSKDDAKTQVKAKYVGQSAKQIQFAKPKNKDGLYAIIMESNEFFYERATTILDTYCLWHSCHKPIKGPLTNFPHIKVNNEKDELESFHFCSYQCKEKFYNRNSEGEWQTKEEGLNGEVFGYIYHIYNKQDNSHYIGQTKFLPFFRWQEHVKSKIKGDLMDLIFETIAQVRKSDKSQQLLNSTEAWWIKKFIEEGYNVINISNPQITIEDMKIKFNEMVSKQQNLIDLADEN